MSLYTESEEEALRAKEFLKQGRDDGLLTGEEYARLNAETACSLRTTNVFLRIVLLVFTLLAVAATVALFFELFNLRPSNSSAGICFLVFAASTYAASEFIVREAGLYRYGFEEALAISSIPLCCAGLDILFFGNNYKAHHAETLFIATTATTLSLWLWHQFGLWYAFIAATVAAAFLPNYWFVSREAQRCVICLLYGLGLVAVAKVGARHRFDYLRPRYSLAEAFLWQGIYLVLNIKLSAIQSPVDLWTSPRYGQAFAPWFYWTTWVLAWCLPPIILLRAVRRKSRPVLAVGMITALLTLATNKSYLGWQRHTWDPILLGIVLIAVAALVLRWLAKAPNGTRHGFTSASTSGKQAATLAAASSMLVLVAPHTITPAGQPRSPEFDSGFGGSSGGAGASGGEF